LIEIKLPSLKARYRDDEEALQVIACEETEIEMFRKYSIIMATSSTSCKSTDSKYNQLCL
jgi:hypothetical protein